MGSLGELELANSGAALIDDAGRFKVCGNCCGIGGCPECPEGVGPVSWKIHLTNYRLPVPSGQCARIGQGPTFRYLDFQGIGEFGADGTHLLEDEITIGTGTPCLRSFFFGPTFVATMYIGSCGGPVFATGPARLFASVFIPGNGISVVIGVTATTFATQLSVTWNSFGSTTCRTQPPVSISHKTGVSCNCFGGTLLLSEN